MWASGFLYKHVPAVGPGYPKLFYKAQAWIENQVFELVGPIKRLGGK
jgi:hypothetical protein